MWLRGCPGSACRARRAARRRSVTAPCGSLVVCTLAPPPPPPRPPVQPAGKWGRPFRTAAGGTQWCSEDSGGGGGGPSVGLGTPPKGQGVCWDPSLCSERCRSHGVRWDHTLCSERCRSHGVRWHHTLCSERCVVQWRTESPADSATSRAWPTPWSPGMPHSARVCRPVSLRSPYRIQPQ